MSWHIRCGQSKKQSPLTYLDFHNIFRLMSGTCLTWSKIYSLLDQWTVIKWIKKQAAKSSQNAIVVGGSLPNKLLAR